MTVGENAIEEVIRAVRAIQDTSTQNVDRIRYTQAIELLKEGPTNQSIPTAFALASNSDKLIAHVGWNIIEHVVKYKWLDLPMAARMQMRNEVLEYISNGNTLMSPTFTHLRTALSRVVVSMIEHDWPENWPEMFSQFTLIVSNSNYMPQCQIVFDVLKRLVENIYTLITVENTARRKNLQGAIYNHASDLIVMTVQRLRLCITLGTSNQEAVLLARSAIELLSEVFDWVSGKVLAESIDDVNEVLCAYLQVDTCGIYDVAANSLLKLAMRKRFKTDELPIILSMFREKTMGAILTACTHAASSTNPTEERYKFLKLLCDLLCALGIHLSETWPQITNPPETFTLYLNALIEFFMHPSMYIRLETAHVLFAFSTNMGISRSPILLEKMPSILMVLPKSMEKTGWLDDANVPTSLYSQMDYDNESEFLQEYTKLRDRCGRLIRANLESHFTVLSSIVTTWIEERCLKQTNAITKSEWDSMKRYLIAYLRATSDFMMIEKDVKQWLVILMDRVINHLCSLTDLSIVNEMLSILSAFFIVLESEPTRISPILELLKRLLLTVNNKADSRTNEGQEIVCLKRHCINLILKLVTTLKKEIIKAYVQEICNVVIGVASSVSTMQKANLVQILAALSNVPDNIEEQQALINAAFQDAIVFFESEEFTMCFTTHGLLNYVGALESSSLLDEQLQNTVHLNRLKLRSQLVAIEGALAHISVPKNASNPLFSVCLPSIRNIFEFASALNSIYNHQTLPTIHPCYRNDLYTLSGLERKRVIYSSTGGLDSEDTCNSYQHSDSLAHMRRFFMDTNETLQKVIGLVGEKFAYDFYALPDAQTLIELAFTNADYLPDLRLRFWIKRAWTPVISCCTADKAQVVKSITSSLCRHLHGLLTNRWSTIKSFDEDGGVTEEELFSQQMVCILSREYADFLSHLFIKPILIKDINKKAPSDMITSLGSELLKDQAVLEPVVASVCLLINCPDTKTVTKTVPLTHQIISHQYASFDTEMAANTLVHTIRSLQINGNDEACLGPLLSLNFITYSLLRPKHPTLLTILEQVPKLQESVRREFDEKIVTCAYNNEKFGEKSKRDLMRKLLRSIIACNIGEEFKRPVPMQTTRKNPPTSMIV